MYCQALDATCWFFRYDPRQVFPEESSANVTRSTNGFQQRYAAPSVDTCSTLLGTHLPFAGQYAYPNMAVKITLTLSVPAVNYSRNPLIIEAFGRQLCLPPPPRLLNLVAALHYIVLLLVV
jgi:hypothetical protein